MPLRKATRQRGEVRAECPNGEVCRYMQITQGKSMMLFCGYLDEVLINMPGTMVRCRLEDKGE